MALAVSEEFFWQSCKYCVCVRARTHIFHCWYEWYIILKW